MTMSAIKEIPIVIEHIDAALGDTRTITLPYSEVCCFMGVAGKQMKARLLADGNAVQLYDQNDRVFSFPITRGEAGWL
jgi:hypothetical protein